MTNKLLMYALKISVSFDLEALEYFTYRKVRTTGFKIKHLPLEPSVSLEIATVPS